MCTFKLFTILKCQHLCHSDLAQDRSNPPMPGENGVVIEVTPVFLVWEAEKEDGSQRTVTHGLPPRPALIPPPHTRASMNPWRKHHPFPLRAGEKFVPNFI